MLGSVRCRPLALKLPIQKATVRWLLAWRPTALAAHRARLLTAMATLACMLVNEVTRLQVCDLLFDYLASYGMACAVKHSSHAASAACWRSGRCLG
jgi:hypothetical protein